MPNPYPARPHPEIAHGENHLWWVRVPPLSSRALEQALPLLDDAEKLTYLRYRLDRKRVEFLTGRVLAKTVLGMYLNAAPRLVRFTTSSYGKPSLIGLTNNLNFNISHTNGLTVLGVSQHGAIGADVERTHEKRFEIMRRVYQSSEMEFVHQQPDVRSKLQAFYTIWTRKEAVLKAVGKGFALSPLSFAVPTDTPSAKDAAFDFFTFQPLPGYLISVATDRRAGPSAECVVREVGLTWLFCEANRS